MHHGRKSRVICAVVSLKVQSTVDGFQSEVKLTDSVECSPRAPESDNIWICVELYSCTNLQIGLSRYFELDTNIQ